MSSPPATPTGTAPTPRVEDGKPRKPRARPEPGSDLGILEAMLAAEAKKAEVKSVVEHGVLVNAEFDMPPSTPLTNRAAKRVCILDPREQ